MSLVDGIEADLAKWLVTKRWFGSETADEVTIVAQDVLRDAWPKLLWLLVEVNGSGTYQVPVGVRPESQIGGVLLGHDDALIARRPAHKTEPGLLLYDATIDPVLTKVLFDVITDGELSAKSVRGLNAEQSNTSLIYDNRYIVKMFRRLQSGSNPDLEVTRALANAGLKNVAPIVATWQRSDYDLAVCQPYLWDGIEGWKLALTSVRDFLAADMTGGSATVGSPLAQLDRTDPASAGGDFADEARRIGEVTAEIHVALSREFPTVPFDPTGLIASLEGSTREVPESLQPKMRQVIEAIDSLTSDECGAAIRVHGDYHLGQTLRSVTGWYVFDFEGEPARPMHERTAPSSPMKDVAGMLRSFHYASAAGMREQAVVASDLMDLQALAWEQRNRDAFRDGYMSNDEIGELMPRSSAHSSLILKAFELEKVIYELRYERAYRPDWVEIPMSGLERLLEG